MPRRIVTGGALVLRPSRGWLALLLLGTVVFAAIGVVFVRSGQHVLVGWASIVFWGHAAPFTPQLATWRRRLSRANRLLGMAELNLNLATLPVRAEEVVAEIERQRAARRGS